MVLTTRDTTTYVWQRLARRARVRRRLSQGALHVFLIIVSVPVMLPYLGLFVMSFVSDEPRILWRTVAVVAPAGAALLAWCMWAHGRRAALLGSLAIVTAAAAALWALIGADLHFGNFRFLWSRTNASFPSVWTAFGNSLIVALTETAVVATVASMAGYYLSRFAFPLRGAMLRALLMLLAVPVMTLIVPLFLMLYYVGLLDSLTGVILVLVAFELPFAIFIMKGFFDAVPWEFEMAAIVDGATRRQAFLHIILPQATTGIVAVSIFAFIRGWEEYIFVSTFLFGNTKWLMSLYLFFRGNAPAVALFYLLPPMLLFVFTQKYLLRLSIGGGRV